MRKIYTTALLLCAAFTFAHAQLIFEDDFENYDLGPVLDQNADVWGAWSGNNMNANETMETTDEITANSGSKCGVIREGIGPQDALLLMGNRIAGVYEVEFQMFVPAGRTAYFNVQGTTSAFSGAGDGGMGVFNSLNLLFNNTQGPDGGPGQGGGFPDIESNATYTWTYPEDQWFPVHFLFNVDDGNWVMTIDEVEVTAENFGEENVLGGLNFFSLDANTLYYVDDFEFSEVAPSGLAEDPTLFTSYPNPVTDKLYIQTETTVDLVEVFNALGQSVLVERPDNTSPVIGMEDLETGVYLVRVISGNLTKTIRVLK